MTKIYENPVTMTLDSTYSKLTDDFLFYSDIIGDCTVPTDFTFD